MGPVAQLVFKTGYGRVAHGWLGSTPGPLRERDPAPLAGFRSPESAGDRASAEVERGRGGSDHGDETFPRTCPRRRPVRHTERSCELLRFGKGQR
jgi:hypothetical protein